MCVCVCVCDCLQVVNRESGNACVCVSVYDYLQVEQSSVYVLQLQTIGVYCFMSWLLLP